MNKGRLKLVTFILCLISFAVSGFIIYDRCVSREVINVRVDALVFNPDRSFMYESALPDGTIIKVIQPLDVEDTSVDLPLHLQYFAPQMSEAELGVYNSLMEGISKHTERIELEETVTEEQLYRIWSCFLNNQLDVSFVSTQLKYESQDDKILAILLQYITDSNMLWRKRFDVATETEEYYTHLETLSTDYEKVKYIHDTLLTLGQYDADEEAQDLYAVLFKNKANCTGYSKAFAYLCNRCGIQSCIVTGTARGNHMWNKVKIGNAWYNVDITWDAGDFTAVGYEYFLVSDKEIAKTHTPDTIFNYPRAENGYNISE